MNLEALIGSIEGSDSDSTCYSYEESDEACFSDSQNQRTEKIKWQTDANLKQLTFIRKRKLLTPSSGANPFDYMKLLLTDEFLKEILKHTNRMLTKKSQNNLTKKELLVFIGLLLKITNSKYEAEKYLWKIRYYETIVFRENMHLYRFLMLMQSVCFADNDEKTEDRLHKVRYLVNFFNKRMSDVYYPGREFILDDSLVLRHNHLKLRDKVKDISEKNGLKIYMLAEPKGPVIKLDLYPGRLDDYRQAHIERVIMRLLTGKLNVGHALYLNEYYNNIDLAMKLIYADTHVEGEINCQARLMPRQVRSTVLKQGESVARCANGVLVGKFKGKHEVCYLSTEHANELIEVKSRHNTKRLKPLPVVNSDKYLFIMNWEPHFLDIGEMVSWPMRIFVHILIIMVVNAHNFYTYDTKRKLNVYKFKTLLIEELVKNTNSTQME